MGSIVEQVHDIVIVGGGICGLATALALHRKGIKSVVLEKAESLRAAGVAIGVQANGWLALDQLLVGDELRDKAIPLSEIQYLWPQSNKTRTIFYRRETRCLRRKDLIETLAKHLPAESISFGCQIVAVNFDPFTSLHTVSTSDGRTIKAKVLIGCDGLNSVIAKSLGLHGPKPFPIWSARGLTSYPQAHNFGNRFLFVLGKNVNFGRVPIDDKSVHFFVGFLKPPRESTRDPKLIKEIILEALQDIPTEISDTVKQCDLDSLTLTQTWFRAPWNLIFTKFHKNNSTVAGDAMHVMGPFLGQGGSAALEDAVVVARCLSKAMPGGDSPLADRIEEALSTYVKERRQRILRLSAQSYLVGSIFAASTWVKKMGYIVLLTLLFGGNSSSHTKFDCGAL